MTKKIIIIFTIIFLFFNTIYGIEISSPAAVVICEDTGRILYSKNCDEIRKMASLTKLMTAIILVENCNMEEEIIIDKRACYVGGSEAGIKPNEKIKARDLLYGMLLPSGNDCAAAIAYHIGGDLPNFAVMMNQKAKELGLKHTNFVTPHGLDNDDHYTTAYEMAIISRYAKHFDEIEKAVSSPYATVTFDNRTVELRNTNALLRTYDKATGMKTGFTNGANRCLSASASYNNLNLIAVVLGSDTSQIRFDDTKNILEDTFEKYYYYDLSQFTNIYIDIPVKKGKITNYVKVYKDLLGEALTKEEYEKIHVSQELIDTIKAPLEKGTYIGKYTVSIEDEILYWRDLYLEDDIEKKNLMDYFIFIFSKLFETMELI